MTARVQILQDYPLAVESAPLKDIAVRGTVAGGRAFPLSAIGPAGELS